MLILERPRSGPWPRGSPRSETRRHAVTEYARQARPPSGEHNLANRHPDLTCFRWVIDLQPAGYRQSELVIKHHAAPALAAARSSVPVKSAYVSKHVDEHSVWLTIFASLGNAGPLLN